MGRDRKRRTTWVALATQCENSVKDQRIGDYVSGDRGAQNKLTATKNSEKH